MRIKRILATAAVLTALATLTACEDGEREGGRGGAAGAATAPPRGPGALPGPTEVSTLAEAQKYVQQYAPCENMSASPEDKRLPRTPLTAVGAWSVTERGVCADRDGREGITLYLTSDMKAFQEAYKQRVMDRNRADEPTYGLFSRVFVGGNLVVVPSRTETAVALAESGLRILTCNAGFGVPKGYKKEKALVEHCVLSDFVNSDDGKGSVNHQTPEEEGKERGESARPLPSRAPGASLGLPSAGSLTGLRKLVEHSVDCSRFTTDPETVSIRSIDYLPAVEGDHKAWGVRERGICGEPGGARRAHGLVWLDTVHDMLAFQNREKAAQLAELKENGRIRATRSKVLIGTDIAVETNDQASRHGLYQQQFLHLNCRPGFTAPEGYRLEKAVVKGCVLTNYED
ncbi:hypothetical protein SMD11_6439 [Streptomyces albireticuli]|uniref:Lipoprotein n=1 Tax=Streptomyces albireticuli TaxID=1940 RepID=A0A1Z2LCK4_9ACTN|nr:hypothetical protein [Streptomyces albireticuli]ARZ72015.1 hypothetical protein SMD11_6439 [Streptomyces albireticuli]